MKLRIFLFAFVLGGPLFGQSLSSSNISNEMCAYFTELDGKLDLQSSSAAYSKFLGDSKDKMGQDQFNELTNTIHSSLLENCPKYLKFSTTYSDFLIDMFSNHAEEKFDDVALMDLNDRIINVSNFSTKLLIIDFWATWCGPCVSHIGDQKVLYDKFKSKYGQSIEWLNISVDKDTTKWKSFLESNYKPGKNLIGEIEFLQRAFGINRYPTYVLVNEELEILGFEIADLNWPTLESFEYLVDMAINGHSAAAAWRKIKIPGTNQDTKEYLQWKEDFYKE